MESALSPADDSDETALKLLEKLHSHPEVLNAVYNSSPEERVNQKKLRKEFPAELVREAVSLHEIRQRGHKRVPYADRLWLTRTGLEQATTWDVAVHKAKRFEKKIAMADLCCGIGIDAAALSKSTPVLAIDSNPLMVRRMTWNSEILGNPSQVTGEVDDVTCRDWTGWFIHADPDRRGDRPRPTRRLESYLPDIKWMHHILKTARGGAIKVGPASNWPQHFATRSCEIELVSLAGECREATIWFGELAGKSTRRATNLTTGESLTGNPSVSSRTITPLDTYICEPDPAVIRAGIIETLAEDHSLSRIDYDEEYLTASQKPETSLVTPFAVEAILPAGLKHIRRYFVSQPRHHYEIKCRRLPVDIESVRRRLPLGDGPPSTIIFCRVAEQSRAVIARRL